MPTFDIEQLHVSVSKSVAEMAASAAARAGRRIKGLLSEQETVRAVFAAAASQDAFLEALLADPEIDWGRVEVLQLDEYVGLDRDNPLSLANWLERHLTGQVAVRRTEYMDGAAGDLVSECARYGAALTARPIDLGFLGVGENGHLAFNDPHVADLNDPDVVKVVEIDETSRMQQVHDGAFADLASVPGRALTITLPTILHIRTLVVVVPGAHKAPAIARALLGPVSSACPASSLRRHPDATLYVDPEAFKEADGQLMAAT